MSEMGMGMAQVANTMVAWRMTPEGIEVDVRPGPDKATWAKEPARRRWSGLLNVSTLAQGGRVAHSPGRPEAAPEGWLEVAYRTDDGSWSDWHVDAGSPLGVAWAKAQVKGWTRPHEGSWSGLEEPGARARRLRVEAQTAHEVVRHAAELRADAAERHAAACRST